MGYRVAAALLLYDWGLQSKCIWDRDLKFVSEMWTHLFRLMTKIAMGFLHTMQT